MIPAVIEPEHVVAKAPQTAWQVIEGEAVILDLEGRMLRGLNPVGSRVWQLIDGQRSVRAVAEVIAAEFQVALSVVLADVEAFLADLHARRLIVISPPHPSPSPSGTPAGGVTPPSAPLRGGRGEGGEGEG